MIHSGHIEVAVANLLNFRVFTIVPNVSFGLGLSHEADMLCLDQKDRFTEVEIKTSMSDLRADFKKSHGHQSDLITRLIYAFPVEMLSKAEPLIPKECGIIVVYEKTESSRYPGLSLKKPILKARWERQCRHRKRNTPIPPQTIRKFMELGCMRIWSLKSHNNK